MIDWDKSAELNGMNVADLKVYFDKYPRSDKRIIRICDICKDDQEVRFAGHSESCRGCSLKTLEYRRLRSEIAIRVWDQEARDAQSYRMKKYYIDNPTAAAENSAQQIQFYIDNPEAAVMISKAALAPKEPLPDGWESKLSDITDNKKSAVYLGSIAETMLSRIYNDVQVMPVQNHGFDIICNRDKMIDIKSCATGYKGHWDFHINKNQIADLFLCIAFESRDDLKNPVHLWMIPGTDVNHMSGIRISKASLDKWSKYELPLDELIACCNTLHNDKERGN